MKVTERFLKYVCFDTTSNPDAPETACPSTEKQKLLGAALVEELKSFGLADARMDGNGYVTAILPANTETDAPALGFISHMDTAPSAEGAGIKPRIVRGYDGGDILLNENKQIFLCPADYPELRGYAGKDIIVTDGTTLLGADDKAGVAEIMTAVERIQKENLPHGKLCIGFTPDEEIGRGANRFDVPGFGAQFAYTVDGGALGEIEYENFNAADGSLVVHGANIHPGSAKLHLKHALLIGMEFHAMLPVFENPAFTEGYEGFFHLCHMEGEEEKAELHYIIRDHDRAKFEEKKARFQKIADYLNEKYGAGTVEATLSDSYYNMKEQVEPHMFLIDNAREAMQKAGAKPEIIPIRGGTDGARLSYMGLPCPNLSTGGHNFHGRFEYVPVQSMETMVEVLLNLACPNR